MTSGTHPRPDAGDATGFVAHADPADVVARIHASDDEALLELVGAGDVRGNVVRSLLRRLHEYAVQDRVAGIRGDVRIELAHPGAPRQDETIRLAGGRVTLLTDQPEHADVVLRTSLVHFLRIVSGEQNAGLAFLRGTLDIEGDADLALAVGGMFRVPGSNGVAVDPRALDPVAVATALGEVEPDHLRKVMRSGFRGVVLGEIFRRLPDFVDPGRAADVDLTVGFRLTGNPSGDVERYVVQVGDGSARVAAGEKGGTRDATVTCEGHDFLRLATGHLNPLVGVLRGRLKVKGDQAAALRLSNLIDIPQPE